MDPKTTTMRRETSADVKSSMRVMMFSQTCKLEKKILVAGKEKKGEWTREPQRERERAREPQTEKKEVRRMAQAHALIAAGDWPPQTDLLCRA